MDIDGAVVVITGASSGIGAATARAAAAAGARSVLLARREDRLRELSAELGDALFIRCDVTRPDEVTAAVHAILARHGRIDGLEINAGQGLQSAIDEIEPDDFRAILELNVVAPQMLMRAVIPIMRKQGGGSIVNVGSGISFFALPESGAYSASKAALAKLSAIARAELADTGIAVSTLYPFITRTEFVTSLRAGHEAAVRLESNFEAMRQTTEQVADAVLQLIATGEEQINLVPEAIAGGRQG